MTDTGGVWGNPGPGEEEWRLFRGDGEDRHLVLPPAPPWRRFPRTTRATERPYLIGGKEADIVSAALHLRRPLLVTGHPGTGKSSLAYAIARELRLGTVLTWPVNSRSTVQDALYQYDAVGRLRESNRARGDDEPGLGIGSYVRLGPLGTALLPVTRPRVLLVDELDKGDLDLPNDLLNVFEEGEFEIPELARLPDSQTVVAVMTSDAGDWAELVRGRVRCEEFPVVVITSNGEREFPPAFLRRCIRLDLPDPDEDKLRAIVAAHLGKAEVAGMEELMAAFLNRRARGELATDQLLNAVFLRMGGVSLDADGLLDAVLHRLSGTV